MTTIRHEKAHIDSDGDLIGRFGLIMLHPQEGLVEIDGEEIPFSLLYEFVQLHHFEMVEGRTSAVGVSLDE